MWPSSAVGRGFRATCQIGWLGMSQGIASGSSNPLAQVRGRNHAPAGAYLRTQLGRRTRKCPLWQTLKRSERVLGVISLDALKASRCRLSPDPSLPRFDLYPDHRSYHSHCCVGPRAQGKKYPRCSKVRQASTSARTASWIALRSSPTACSFYSATPTDLPVLLQGTFGHDKA